MIMQGELCGDFDTDYTVSAVVDESYSEVREWRCSCEESWDGMCSHCVALLVEYLQKRKAKEVLEIEDVLEDYPVEIYDENNELVDTVDFQGYEGQITITVAGTASYYILSAIASFIFTYEVYTIIKASTASKSKAKRKGGVAIPKDQVPRRRKKNKKVKGKNGSLSTTGTPDSSTDLYSKNGKKLYQRRFYDRKGKVFLDIDFSHGGNHTFPHAHYWIWY